MWRNTPIAYEGLTLQIPAKELSKLLEVSVALASTLELADVLQIAITSATDLLGIETGAIYTLEKEKLCLGATVPPLPSQFPDELRQADLCDHPHIREAMVTKAPVYLSDARTASLTPAEKVVVDTRHLVSILYFPLLLKGTAIGAFIVGTTSDVRWFTENEISLCHILSSQASLAVTNARLYEETQQAIRDLTRTYNATLEGWSRVLDMRDHITDVHTQRVAELTIALARRMGIPETDHDHIRRGALLHDIGKMGIPDAILQKPGELTTAEREWMQKHPELAYELLSQIDYLVPALDIPYCHHEKWDGSGYPRGLKGEEIPLAARIFAVIDVFDSLTSDRSYRKAWDRDTALAYIREQSGRYFDPAAVAAFFDLLNDDTHPPEPAGS